MRITRATILLPALLLAAWPAWAGPDSGKRAKDLPGVRTAKQADQPRGEPDRTVIDRPGTFRAGNWDVTISGSVSVTVGTGPISVGR